MTVLRTRALWNAPSSGGLALFTYYWGLAVGTPSDVMTEAAARVHAFWDSFKTFMPNTGSITIDNFGDEVDPATGLIVGQAVGVAVAAVNGTAGGDVLPFQTQGLLRFSTSNYVSGRRVKGRQFIPQPNEVYNAGGVPTSAYTGGLATAAALLGTTISTAAPQQIWHRPGGSGAGAAYDVTSRAVSPSWAVLRSRRS